MLETILLIILLFINLIVIFIDKTNIKEKFTIQDLNVSETIINDDINMGTFTIGNLQFVFGLYKIQGESTEYPIDFNKVTRFPFLSVYGVCATPANIYDIRTTVYYKDLTTSGVKIVSKNSSGSFFVWGYIAIWNEMLQH